MFENVPPRKRNALTGSEFYTILKQKYNYTQTLPANHPKGQVEEWVRIKRENEDMTVMQAKLGNMPEYLRRKNFKPIHLKKTIDGKTVEVTLYAARDYLAIGKDDNCVRAAITIASAYELADYFGWALPTMELVDEIDGLAKAEKKAKGRLLTYHTAPFLARLVTDPSTGEVVSKEGFKDPENYSAYDGIWMQSPHFAELQSRKTNDEMKKWGLAKDGWVSGPKKDYIEDMGAISTETMRKLKGPGLCFYHKGRQNAACSAHPVGYADYSHGFRPVDNKRKNEITITHEDGRKEKLALTYEEILDHQWLHKVVSSRRIDIKRLHQLKTAMVSRRSAIPQRIAQETKPRKRLPPRPMIT